MTIKTSDFQTFSGLLLEASAAESISAIDPKFLLDNLASKGYLILRGFEHSIDAFSKLVRSASSKMSLDPARRFNGDTAQKVDAGIDKVGLHCENGNSPFWPDLCWFYCQVAPQSGSQTTICDGKEVYEHMSETQKSIFSQDIQYSRHVEEQKWKLYAYHSLLDSSDGPKQVDEITIEHLLSLTDGSPSTQITLNRDGSIKYCYQTAAIRPSQLNRDETHNFANSIFGPSNHYEKPIITFANGEVIPQDVLNQMEQLCEEHTYNVDWQEGDIVMIDNTRVMHGRRKIEDEKRTIFNALSYL